MSSRYLVGVLGGELGVHGSHQVMALPHQPAESQMGPSWVGRQTRRLSPTALCLPPPDPILLLVPNRCWPPIVLQRFIPQPGFKIVSLITEGNNENT